MRVLCFVFASKGDYIFLILRQQWSSLLLCLHTYLYVLLIPNQPNSQVDLAEGHRLALRKLETMRTGCIPVNLGTGKGLSVMDIVKVCDVRVVCYILFVIHP